MTEQGVQPVDAVGQRPIAITVVCVVMIIGAVATVPLMFSEAARALPSWYTPYLAFSVLIGLACTGGLWMMQKWAVYTFIAFALVNQVILGATGLWNVLALLLSGIKIGVMLIYLPRMK